jgi:hypothetical protein
VHQRAVGRTVRLSSEKIGHAKRVVAFCATLAVIGAEAMHRNASRRGRSASSRTASVGVVVLGYHSRKDGGIHPIQRWRIEIVRRSLVPAVDGIVVFTGGSRVGVESEADAMATHAAVLGVNPPRTAIENRSLRTWENVRFSLPMVDHCESIVFASDPMHAYRVRPDLADRITSGEDYRFLERWWLKVPTAIYESQASIRAHVNKSDS